MQFHFHTNQSHFHNNGFALRLALKQRQKGTLKWPIHFGLTVVIFSAECTIGMVWGLTVLKDYCNKTIRCKL